MQQKEITANTKAINLQEMSARRLEVHSQRDSYFKLLNLVQAQLGGVASFHYMSVCGPTGTGEISTEEFLAQRSQMDSSDHAWFVRRMIALALQNREDHDKLVEIFYGTEVRTRHSKNFIDIFSRLHANAKAVDTDDMISNALVYGSAIGMLYRILKYVSGEEPVDPFTGLSGVPARA